MSGPRIIAGAFKGRRLVAPEGGVTRPSHIRARQAVFDILAHASWCDLRGAKVLDVFAGTGAYGLEALSRGAAFAHFIEQAPAALAVLKANIVACKAQNTRVINADALNPTPGEKQDMVFLDPPYGQSLLTPAIAALERQGWIGDGTIIIAEAGPGDEIAAPDLLAERVHGKARLKIWRVRASLSCGRLVEATSKQLALRISKA